jgi:hypothetical protein
MNKIKGLRQQALVVGAYTKGASVPNLCQMGCLRLPALANPCLRLPAIACDCAGEDPSTAIRLKHVALFLAVFPALVQE